MTSASNIKSIGKFLSKLAEKSNTVYWLSTTDFEKIVYVSPAYERIWGRKVDELYKDPSLWIKYLHPEDSRDYHPTQAMADRLLTQGQAARYEESYRIVRPDGEVRWIADRGFPLYDDQGNCYGVTGVAIDVTREKQIEIELRASKEKAEAANLAKTNFLATVGHELRNPLNGIVGAADILSRTSLGKKQLGLVQDISAAGRSLTAIVGDILNFAKLEAGQLELDIKPFNLVKTVKQVVNNANLLIEGKRLKVMGEVDKAVPQHLKGDKLRIIQILTNLVNNAIKFTPQGSITVHLAMVKETQKTVAVRFSVADTGIGIPKNMRNKVFDRFVQVNDKNFTRRYGGVGLGLSICNELVAMMNSRIKVNTTLGEGSEFYFTIKFPKVLQTEIPGSKTKKTLTNTSHASCDILLVEDEPLNQKVCKMLFEELNLNLTIAKDGQEGIALANKKKYDLIFMDIRLPDINGMEVMKRIRKNSKNKDTTIIAMTAHALDYEIKMFKESGMDDVVTKPINSERICELLACYT